MIRISHLLVSVLLFGATLGKPLSSSGVQSRWKNRGQVVFLGDSITDWWRTEGKETWDQFYEPLGSVNTGVAGDRTSMIIDRINNQGILDNLNAYLAVLKIGTNDLSANIDQQTIVNNIGTIINLIKSKNPGVRILLLGVLPRGGSEIHQRVRDLNKALASSVDNDEVFFLDMEQQFSSGLGVIIPELFWDDQLHLSPEGYAVWAETMNPIFNTILNSPFSAKAVWLGDSLTERWRTTGAPIWTEVYAPIESLNVAVSGHTSSQTIDRILNDGVLDGINSKVAMLMVGGNDLTSGAQASAVIENIQRIIELIRDRLPHGRILLFGLLPAGGVPQSVIEQGKLINTALSQMENADDIRYLEMLPQFSDENEEIYQELYDDDGRHLSLEGYAVWQRTMEPLFQELLAF